MQDISSYMNPFHNMAKYRELQRSTGPPLIPFFPIIKKDLTFLYDGNATQVGGLVNFEKLRMLSQQIRSVKNFCQRTILVSWCVAQLVGLKRAQEIFPINAHLARQPFFLKWGLFYSRIFFPSSLNPLRSI